MSKELFQEYAELSQKGILSEQERRRFQFLTKSLPSGGVNPTQKNVSIAERAAKKYSDLFTQWIVGKLPEEQFRRVLETAPEFRVDNQTTGYWGNVTGQSYTGGDLQGGTSSGVAGGFTVPVE